MLLQLPNLTKLLVGFLVYQFSVSPWWYNFFSKPWMQACQLDPKKIDSSGMMKSLGYEILCRFAFMLGYCFILE